MKKIVKILILCLSCIGACWFLPACSSAIEEPESGGGSDGSTVTLKLNAMVPGYETRAEGNEFTPDIEKIDNLRIFIVNKNTKEVVYNSNFSNPFQYRDDEFERSIQVEKNTTQVVYFLANAEEYCEDLPEAGNIYSDLDGDNDLYNEVLGIQAMSILSTRADDSSERIPYTSRYEINIEEKDVEKTCYIAIAAVKFSFTFTNNTRQEITVSDFKISSIADCSYLLPRNDEWDKWVENVTGDGEKKYFTNYKIPSYAKHNEFTVPIPSSGNEGESGVGTETSASSFTVPTGDNNTYLIPDFYCHESKHILPFPDAKDQQYFIQFKIGEEEYVAEIQDLKSLIRSTHVIVNIKINKLSEDETHEIVVWGKITDWKDLNPVEGGLEEVEP